MMPRSFKTVAAALLCFTLFESHASEVYFVGHSLVNHEMPRVLDQIAEDMGHPHGYKEAVIGGSPLRYHWNNPDRAEGDADVRTDLPGGAYDTLVLTEGVPLQTSFQWNSPVHYATQFINLALPDRPNLRVVWYETWPHLNNIAPRNWHQATWDEELAVDLDLLEDAAQSLEDTMALETPVLIVPAGLALQALRDAIAAGTVPGLTALSDIFADDIHMTYEGNYFIALVFFASLYGENPAGATGRITNQWGGIYTDVPAARRDRYQQIVWDVVAAYPRGGVLGVQLDRDRDGFPDAEDACPDSRTGAVTVFELSPAVPNPIDAQGCTLADAVAACTAAGGDRQTLYACLEDAAAPYVAAGTLTPAQAQTLADCAWTHGLPLPTDDQFTVMQDTVLTVAAPGVLQNDTDVDNDPMQAFMVQAPAAGALSLLPNGSFTYTPDPGFVGTDSFTYACDDGSGAREAQVTLQVMPQGNDADGDGVPDAEDACPDTRAGLTVVINGCDSGTPNLHMGDGCFLSDEIDAMTASNPPRWRFEQDLQTRLYTYRNQGLLTTSQADDLLVCAKQYDLPTAVPDHYATQAGITLSVPAPGLLGNDYDLEGDLMETHIHQWPAQGWLSLPRDGSFTYIPPAGFTGVVTFVYRAWDGSGYRTAEVTIDVH